MIIYKTTNLVTGKIYVGQDSKNNPKYLGSGKILKIAFEKYGKENFKKEILEFCTTKEELNEREIYWIEELKARVEFDNYNLTRGGEGGAYSPTIETRKKISETLKKNHPLKGKKQSQDTKDKISKGMQDKNTWMQGTVLSAEHKENISKGVKNSEKYKEGMSKIDRHQVALDREAKKRSEGTNKLSEETKKKIGLGALGNKSRTGQTWSEEERWLRNLKKSLRVLNKSLEDNPHKF